MGSLRGLNDLMCAEVLSAGPGTLKVGSNHSNLMLSIPVMSNTVATSHAQLFKFNFQLIKIEKSVPQLDQPCGKCSRAPCGYSQGDSTDGDHFPHHRKFYQTALLMLSVPTSHKPRYFSLLSGTPPSMSQSYLTTSHSPKAVLFSYFPIAAVTNYLRQWLKQHKYIIGHKSYLVLTGLKSSYQQAVYLVGNLLQAMLIQK